MEYYILRRFSQDAAGYSMREALTTDDQSGSHTGKQMKTCYLIYLTFFKNTHMPVVCVDPPHRQVSSKTIDRQTIVHMMNDVVNLVVSQASSTWR